MHTCLLDSKHSVFLKCLRGSIVQGSQWVDLRQRKHKENFKPPICLPSWLIIPLTPTNLLAPYLLCVICFLFLGVQSEFVIYFPFPETGVVNLVISVSCCSWHSPTLLFIHVRMDITLPSQCWPSSWALQPVYLLRCLGLPIPCHFLTFLLLKNNKKADNLPSLVQVSVLQIRSSRKSDDWIIG